MFEICCRTRCDIPIAGKCCWAAAVRVTGSGSRYGIAASVSRARCLIYFKSISGAPDAERGGIGLGLAIVRRMGEMLDHRIDVRSIPGKGTMISVEVPRGNSSRGAIGRPQTPRYEKGKCPDSVLVVEDEANMRSSLGRLLKMRGIAAVVVATASDALAQINHPGSPFPDLLICDYNLRGSAERASTRSMPCAQPLPATFRPLS